MPPRTQHQETIANFAGEFVPSLRGRNSPPLPGLAVVLTQQPMDAKCTKPGGCTKQTPPFHIDSGCCDVRPTLYLGGVTVQGPRMGVRSVQEPQSVESVAVLLEESRLGFVYIIRPFSGLFRQPGAGGSMSWSNHQP